MGSLLQDPVELAWLWNKMLPSPLANFQRVATVPDSSTEKVQPVALESRQPRNQGLLVCRTKHLCGNGLGPVVLQVVLERLKHLHVKGLTDTGAPRSNEAQVHVRHLGSNVLCHFL
eukprot:2162713-Amphidinium_carterae.1